MGATNTLTSDTLEPRYHSPVDQVSIGIAAVGSQGTTTVAAAGAGIRYVVTAASFSMSCLLGNLALSTIGVAIIDGASGGTTYLWRAIATVTSTGIGTISTPPLNVYGTANTALTAEFSASL